MRESVWWWAVVCAAEREESGFGFGGKIGRRKCLTLGVGREWHESGGGATATEAMVEMLVRSERIRNWPF